MRLFRLLPVVGLIPLAGCQTLGLSSPPPAYPDEASSAAPAPAASAYVAQPCPLSAVLSDASRITMMRGDGQTSADVVMTGLMSPPQLQCDYDPSTRVDSVDMTFPLMFTKGPAASSDTQQVTYFVALLNLAGEVIAKKTYTRTINFDGKQSFIATESVDNLVLTLGPGTKPADHQLLIGFQLTPAQLSYNRTRATTPPPPTPAVGARSGPAPGPGPAPIPGTEHAATSPETGGVSGSGRTTMTAPEQAPQPPAQATDGAPPYPPDEAPAPQTTEAAPAPATASTSSSGEHIPAPPPMDQTEPAPASAQSSPPVSEPAPQPPPQQAATPAPQVQAQAQVQQPAPRPAPQPPQPAPQPVAEEPPPQPADTAAASPLPPGGAGE